MRIMQAWRVYTQSMYKRHYNSVIIEGKGRMGITIMTIFILSCWKCSYLGEAHIAVTMCSTILFWAHLFILEFCCQFEITEADSDDNYRKIKLGKCTKRFSRSEIARRKSYLFWICFFSRNNSLHITCLFL